MDFTYKLEDIRLIYAFHAFACILVDKKLCTQRCTPKSEGAANFSFYPEVLRCRDHIKLEMNQIVCWALRALYGTLYIACVTVCERGDVSEFLAARTCVTLTRALRARRARPPEVPEKEVPYLAALQPRVMLA